MTYLNLETKFQTFVENTKSDQRSRFWDQHGGTNKMLGDLMRTFSAYAGALLLEPRTRFRHDDPDSDLHFLFLIYLATSSAISLRISFAQEDLAWKKDVGRVVQGYFSGLMLVTLIVAALNSIRFDDRRN